MSEQNKGQQTGSPNYTPYPPQQQYEPLMQATIRKNMTGYFKDRKNTVIAIWFAVLIGAAFSFLVVEYRLKLNLFLFYIVLLAATGYIMHRDDNLKIKPFIFFSVCFLSIASVFMRLSFPGYIVIAALLLPVLYVLVTVYSSKQEYSSELKTILFRGVCSIGFVHEIIVALASLKQRDNTKKKQLLHVLIGIGITAGLLIIIIPIMLSADEMFRIKLSNIFGDTSIGMFVLKTMLAVFLAMVIFGFFFLITARKTNEKNAANKKELPAVTTIILTITVALAALFTFFAVVQFQYLFIGVTADLPSDFIPAQYAREGYFQLVVLSTLNFAIILTCIFFSKKGSPGAIKAVKGLLAYFNTLNIYLLVSAAYKMSLYQRQFGLTANRLLVYILLAFEAVLIIGLMVKIFIVDMPFLKLAVYFSTAFFAVVSFVNTEAVTLNANINSLYESGDFDFGDIEHQSADVSRVVYTFFIENHDDFSSDELINIERYFEYRNDISSVRSLSEYKENFQNRNWREYNISDHRKYDLGSKLLNEYY